MSFDENMEDALLIELRILNLYRNDGYKVNLPEEGSNGSVQDIVIQKNGRVWIINFYWNNSVAVNMDLIRRIKSNMDALKIPNGYLYTTQMVSLELKTSSGNLGITMVDKIGLRERGIVRAAGLFTPPVQLEKPLPFEKYIPWFVGISLVLIILVVMTLVSAGVSYGPAPA